MQKCTLLTKTLKFVLWLVSCTVFANRVLESFTASWYSGLAISMIYHTLKMLSARFYAGFQFSGKDK